MICGKNKKGLTPLHLAAENGRVEVVEKITDRCQEAVVKTDNEGNLPLHLACTNVHAEVTKRIVNIMLDGATTKKALAAMNSNDEETPLHCASYNKADNADLMNIVMKSYIKCGILEKELQCANKHGYTPLMLACKKGKPNVVGAIIKMLHLPDGCGTLKCLYNQKVKEGEEKGMNCLDLAIVHGHREMVEVIILSQDPCPKDCWKESLRNTTTGQDSIETTPFRRLIRKMPDLALQVIERCGESCSEFVDDFQSDSWGPEHYRRDNHVLDIMIQESCKDLLKHKRINEWLNNKWGRLGVWLYLANLITYLFYIIILTTFTLKLPNPQSDTCANETSSQRNESATNDHCGVSDSLRNFFLFSVVIIPILSLAQLIVEAILFYSRCREIYRSGFKLHFRDWKFVLEFPLFIMSLIFVIIAVSNECFCPKPSHWQLGTCVVFLAWIDLMTFLYKFPTVGVYLLMMERIVKKFVTVMLLAVLVFLGFGFAFYMTFYEPIRTSPFANPGLSIIKSLSLATGAQVDSIFRFSNVGSGELEPVPYPGLGYLFWILFIAFVAILFLNFLIGLAVEDVSTLQQHAHFEILKLKVKHVLGAEEVLHLFPKFVQQICGSLFKECKQKFTCTRGAHSNTKTSKVFEWLKKAFLKVIHYLWGTKDSDLTIEEKETDYKVDQLMKRSKEQNKMTKELGEMVMMKFKEMMMTISKEQEKVMKKLEEQDKVMTKLEEQEKVMKKLEEQDKVMTKLEEQEKVMMKLEEQEEVIKQQGKMIKELDKVIKEQGKRFEEQKRLINELGEMIVI